MRFSLKINAFTLIELLVSISILSLMAAVSVASYPKFSEQIAVSTQAAKIVSYVREAQVYGSAGYTQPGTKLVYGVEFNQDNNVLSRVQWQIPNPLPSTITNPNSNQTYVTSVTNSGELTLTLDSRFEIEQMCSIQGGISSCSSSAGDYNKVLMLFRRPNPEARLIGQVGTNFYPNDTSNPTIGFQKVEIIIRSKKNTAFAKKIVILQTGQVYVE